MTLAAPVLAGKLDTDVVNGPRDESLDWDAIWWRSVEDDVWRLRRRIFKASQDGDLKRVRNLEKLMLRSRSNTLHSVRRVTQHNAGRKTAGVDGEVALTSPDRAALAVDIHQHTAPWQARPVKRVYIPDAAVMTRSRRSTGRSRAAGPSANGSSTRTCQRRSTASTTTVCSPSWVGSLRGVPSRAGWRRE